MLCCVAHWRQHLTGYSVPRTTWPESSARAGVAPTPGRCSGHFTGSQWDSGSPTKWLCWPTRCSPQLTHKVQSTATPAYLSDLIQTHVLIQTLRSSDAPLLAVPRTRTELARRAFSVAAPSICNSLPADIRLCESAPLFKRHLKTHLFRLT